MAYNYLLGKRSIEILKYLLFTDEYVKIQELSTHFNTSRRSIYYDISKLNDWLTNNKLSPLVNDRSKGVMVQPSEISRIQNLLAQEIIDEQKVLSPEERIKAIICSIIVRDRAYYVEDFIDLCQVSRNTIIADLKNVDSFLEPYNLSLSYDTKRGYRIKGEIIKKRAIFFMLFPQLWEDYPSIMNTIVLSSASDTHNVLIEIEKELNTEFVKGTLRTLSVFIASIEHRNDELSFADMDEKEIQSTVEYNLINKYFNYLKDSEKTYIALHLLGSRLQAVPTNMMKEDSKTYTLAQQLVEKFESVSCMKFDRKEELVNAINAHLKTSLYRYRYGVQLGNPLLSTIKEEYSELFKLTKQSCVILEDDLNVMISDSEIAYLTLHFGAFIPHETDKNYAMRILIICPNGIGAGNMLHSEISALVPQAKEIVNLPLSSYHSNHDYDLVISTMILPNEKNLLVVNPILTDKDRISVLRRCMVQEPDVQLQTEAIVKLASQYIPEERIMEFERDLQNLLSTYRVKKIQHRYFGHDLLHYLKENHIQISNEYETWITAIKKSCNPLLQSGAINENYVQSIIHDQEERHLHMFLCNDLVLAHTAIENGANKLDVSLNIFKHPVLFPNNKTARIIIALSAEDQTKHIKLLNDILQIFSNPNNIEELVKFDHITDVYNYLNINL